MAKRGGGKRGEPAPKPAADAQRRLPASFRGSGAGDVSDQAFAATLLSFICCSGESCNPRVSILERQVALVELERCDMSLAVYSGNPEARVGFARPA